MKIDLHVHTKKTSQGDPETRNIPSTDFFISTLEDNNVGIVAITNHDEFDYEQYKQIEEIAKDKNILVLPGVELNLNLKEGNKQKHFNLIISNTPSNLDKFSDEIAKYNSSTKKVSDLKLFSNKFLLYIDTKKSDKSFRTDDEIKLLKQQLEQNEIKAPVICDVNSEHSLLRYKARSFNTLIGSDIDDWNKYNESASKLLDTNVPINSFDMFMKTFGYNDDQTYINLFEKQKYDDFQNLEIKIGNNKINIGNIKIFDGINVVFGPKASGKTLIINSIHEKCKQKNKKSKIYYSDSKEKTIKEFWKNAEECFNSDEQKNKLKEKFKKIIKNIIDFKDYSFEKWNELFDYTDSVSDIKIDKYFPFQNVLQPKIQFINDAFAHAKNLLQELNNKSFSSFSKIKEHKENIENLINELIHIKIEKSKSFWKKRLYEQIIKEINTHLIKSSGKNIPNKNIGLFNRWEVVKKLQKNVKELKDSDWTIEKKVKHDIPLLERGNVDLMLTYKLWNFNNLDEEISKSNNKTKNKPKEILNEISKEKNIISLKNKILESKELINEMYLNFDKYFKNETRVVNKMNETIKLSNGEEAILALTLFFDDSESDYYILDEPDIYLSAKSLFEFLIKKIWDKRNQNKRIILTTHNPALAINSIPFNMIYRDKNSDTNYFTYQGNPWTNKFVNIKEDEKNEKEFRKLLLEQFEHDIKHFMFRKDIYENK